MCIERLEVELDRGDGKAVEVMAAPRVDEARTEHEGRLDRDPVDGNLAKRPRNVGVNIVLGVCILKCDRNCSDGSLSCCRRSNGPGRIFDLD